MRSSCEGGEGELSRRKNQRFERKIASSERPTMGVVWGPGRTVGTVPALGPEGEAPGVLPAAATRFLGECRMTLA